MTAPDQEKNLAKPEPESTPTEGASSSSTRIAYQRVEYSGPLPHPNTLHQYDQVLPGAAERIFSLTEAEAAHRRSLERADLENSYDVLKRGQFFGLAIGLAGLGVSMFAISSGQPWAAGILGGGTLVGLVSVFVMGRKADSGEPERPASGDEESRRIEEGKRPGTQA